MTLFGRDRISMKKEKAILEEILRTARAERLSTLANLRNNGFQQQQRKPTKNKNKKRTLRQQNEQRTLPQQNENRTLPAQNLQRALLQDNEKRTVLQNDSRRILQDQEKRTLPQKIERKSSIPNQPIGYETGIEKVRYRLNSKSDLKT